ncbi:MAG: nucleotide exchange factor GrpE [Deltaproteobacteria bacterium]|nr:nucleotide exchange factor GrpE [Deltaproteobacteria bacterium]
MIPWLLCGVTLIVCVFSIVLMRRRATAEKEQLSKEWEAKFLHAQSEADAKIARMERDHKTALKRAHLDFVKALLPDLDAFMKAIETAKQNKHLPSDLQEGLSLVLRGVLKTFHENGVSPIVPRVGDTFNPEKHEAIGFIESYDIPEGDIAGVLRIGWKQKSHLLRPAMVQIAQAPSQQDSSKSEHPPTPLS